MKFYKLTEITQQEYESSTGDFNYENACQSYISKNDAIYVSVNEETEDSISFDLEVLENINQEQEEYFEPDADAHNCSMNRDAYGFCQICGAAVPGSMAYFDLYGGE